MAVTTHIVSAVFTRVSLLCGNTLNSLVITASAASSSLEPRMISALEERAHKAYMISWLSILGATGGEQWS